MDPDLVHDALQLACRAPSVHNTQPWRWLVGEQTLHLVADRSRAVPATDPDGRDLLLSCGAAVHHLGVALTGLGWAHRTHLLPNPSDTDHLAAVEVLAEREPDDADVALAAALTRRRTDRRRYSSWPVPAAYLDNLVQVAAREGALLVALEDPFDLRDLAAVAAEAAVDQERDPSYRREVAAWSGRSPGAEDGVTAAASPAAGTEHEMPNRRFPLGELRSPPTAPGERDASRVLLLATVRDTARDHLRAGAAASAVLLTATGMGLATCPLSQPLEVPLARRVLREGPLDDAAAPHLLLRVGFAPISAEPLPTSLRRPLAEVCRPLPGVSSTC
ncbi:Acg family FMN-binding oxidoreductase [Actinokineospora bangkokensis]|uniref:Nitroreductase domain-containing protein n=1 Tax=Actinokineospora bangkokensis TaxID=1193682 RepID=A0A1Q9LR49_9PSEU|nr:nitroreductase family protein [Actinokineospora bangkokensis]OLR94474.1 hypothetical protein BJP25_12045 [Actinokineospora bangkokensis]